LEGFLTTCSFDYLDSSTISQTFILAMCIGVYIGPLVLITASYSIITWNVYIHSKRLRTSQIPTNKNDLKFFSKMRREISTAKATFIVVVCWTIAWTPYAVVALLGFASYTSVLTPLVAQFPAVFAKTAAVYNPFGKLETKMKHEK
jgi:L-cystine uptake protein TcyP (sodium:dicarboxylate symporter family)